MPNTVTFVAEESTSIDVTTYRGTAHLCDLARVSQVDLFDQEINPDGLQRDLNAKHAREAYAYAAPDGKREGLPRGYPELWFNVRDKSVIKLERTTCDVAGRQLTLVAITVDLDKIDAARSVKISRLDGNHRVWLGNGDGKDRAPLEVAVPFSFSIGLTREQEKALFCDVNAEQKGLNSSHLDYMRSTLTPSEREFQRNPARWVTRRLVLDASSPWHGLVYLGGSKAGSKAKGVKHPTTFKALEGATKRLLRANAFETEFTSPDAVYGMVRFYWQAVATVWPEGFDTPEDHYVLKSIGLTSLATLGAIVIDRAQATGNIEPDDLAGELLAVKGCYDWSTEGDLVGMSGNAAVKKIVTKLSRELPRQTRAVPAAA